MSLMSFLLLTMMGFITLVQVESRAGILAVQRAIAREHARMALLMAAGNIQRHLGPDQRVTATSGLRESMTGGLGPMITGVWDTRRDEGSEPLWLVSQTEDGREDTTELVGAGTLGMEAAGRNRVRVPQVAIYNAQGLLSGNFAYWVGDEGVKVSLGKWDRRDVLSTRRDLTDLEIKRLAQVNPGSPRRKWLFPGWDDKGAVGDREWLRNTLAKMRHYEQLSLVHGVSLPELRDHYHRATWNSFGVLSDPERGGLKWDLSFAGSSRHSDVLGDDPEFRHWVAQRVSPADGFSLRGIKASELKPGAPVASRPLILTEFALYVGFFRTGRGADSLRAQVAVRADLWNSHTFPMQFEAPGRPHLVFEIEGLPEHRLSWVTARGTAGEQSGSLPVDLESLHYTSRRNGETVHLSEVPVNFSGDFSVGEVRTIVERAEGPLNASITGDATGTIRDDFIWTQSPPGKLTVRMKMADGTLLQAFEAVPIEAFDTGVMRHNLVSRSSPAYSDYQFVYHFKYFDEVLNTGTSGQLSDLEGWSSVVDPRESVMHFDNNSLLHEFIAISNPAMAAVDNTLFMGRPEFFYGGSGSTQRNFHRFFDLPSVPPVSVGSLQHMQFSGRRPYSVGNPWGGDLNALFDRYFFSAIPRTGDDWNPWEEVDPDRPSLGKTPLPNIHLKTIFGSGADPPSLEELRSPFSSAHFLIRGAFNIHCVDVGAWMAVLGGLHLRNWEYRVNETGFHAQPRVKEHVKNGIFRHSYGADRHFIHPHGSGLPDYPEVTQAEKREWYKNHWQPDWAAAYTMGMRELRDGDNPEGINDLRDLAEQIVAGLKARGRPFYSIRELADSGLIQEAINHTRINTVDARDFNQAEEDIHNRFPKYAPSFLTQADVLQMLAPFAQVRSDTFMIRAYGDSVNPVTGEIESRAWCEARVQRIPQPVRAEPSMVEYRNPSGPFGRKFIIKDFRWLGKDDI